jgi:hypothetical protein
MQIGSGKQGVLIGEYGDEGEDSNAELGYIQPACDNPQWILYFTVKGDAYLYTRREASGALLGEPIRVKARVQKIESPTETQDVPAR